MLFVDKKETFFDYNNKNFSKSQKSPFAKGITHVLVKKCPWRYLDLIKIRLEIMLKTLQSKKKPFGAIKSRIFNSLKIRIFPKGLTHASGPKMPIFSLTVFGQNKTRNNT